MFIVGQTFTTGSNLISATTAPLNWFVSATTGSDNNPGTALLPFLTIQKAIDSTPKQIRNLVSISVEAGNYAGFWMTGFVVEAFKVGTGDIPQIRITGTLIAATGVTGSTSGTFASGTAGTANSATWGTATATAPGWVANGLVGKLVRILTGTGAGQVKRIAFNDTTTLTVCGNWTAPNATSTFDIVQPGTVLNAVGTFDTSFHIYLGANVGGVFAPGSREGIVVENLQVGATGATRGCWTENPGAYIWFNRCDFLNSNQAIASAEDNLFSTVTDCYFTGQTSVVAGSIRLIGGGVWALRNVFNASGFGISDESLSGRQYIISTNNYYRAMTSRAISAATYLHATGDRIDAVTPGTRVGVQRLLSNADVGKMAIQACDISNCGTALSLAESGPSMTLVGVVSGTGNTTGINISKGAALKVSSTTTLTGTTELNIDTDTAQTLAIMRTATPKVIKNLNYGTMVYE